MGQPRKITVADVAAAAGVSASTVSRALRNHSDIPTATCLRIQKLAKELGYRPDPLISALLARRFQKGGAEIGTIAYITAFPTRDGWRYGFPLDAYEGAREQASKRGYLLEPFWLREPKMTGRRLSQILRSRGIRGVLLPPLPHAYGHLRMAWEHFACAAIGYSMIRPSLHRSTAHHLHNTLLALRTLRQQGHRRIGFVLVKTTNRKVGENYLTAALSFKHLYGERSLSILLLDSTPNDPATILEYRKQIKQVIEAWVAAERPNCVFGPRALPLLDLELPEGVPLTLQSPAASAPTLAHIDEKPQLIGAAAIDLIIGQIQRNETGIPTDPKVVMLEGRWVEAG